MAARRIEIGEIYGDYRAVARVKKGVYGMVCVFCGSRREYKYAKFLKNDSPRCKNAECVKPEDAQERPSTKGMSVVVTAPPSNDALDSEYSKFLSVRQEAYRVLDSVSRTDELGFDIAALEALLDMIPYAERRYRKWSTQPNAYAFNSFVTQAREIVADLQASEGRDGLLVSLLLDIMQNRVRDMAQAIIDSSNEYWSVVEPHIPKANRTALHEKVNKVTIDGGRRVHALFKEIENELASAISPAMTPNKKPSKSKRKDAWR